MDKALVRNWIQACDAVAMTQSLLTRLRYLTSLTFFIFLNDGRRPVEKMNVIFFFNLLSLKFEIF